MVKYRTFLATFVCASQIVSSHSFAAPCWTVAEKSAYEVRGLQTMLMVAALKCSAMGGTATRDSYSHFVTVIRPALGTSAAMMMAHFKKLYGPQAQAAMDASITQLANQFSAANGSDDSCIKAADMAAEAAQDAAALKRIAETVVTLPAETQMCEKQ